jgi:hypothetical protein
VRNFIPENLTFSPEQVETLNVLKASAIIGWSEERKAQVRDAADMEGTLSKHIFSDP